MDEKKTDLSFKGVSISNDLITVKNVWLYENKGQWVLSSRSSPIAYFRDESDALDWWNGFCLYRKIEAPAPKKGKPQPKRKNKKAVPSRKLTLARINQGRYDNEKDLLNFLDHANNEGNNDFLKAIKQRLKIVAPNTYRRLVGPIELRDPLGSKKCYCAIPVSIQDIANAIIKNNIPIDALRCDACWKEDICYAWGYYGVWGKKIIPTVIWKKICEERGDTKYASYDYYLTYLK